jgi:hypothetical protein
MKKKILTVILATAACLTSLTATALAATNTTQSQISLYVPNTPTYTITIPETIALSATEHTKVSIVASDVENIAEDKKISVKVSKGSGYKGRLYLEGSEGDKLNGSKPYQMTLEIIGTSGNTLNGALEKKIKGAELVSFTENGTAEYEMWPCALDYTNKTGNLAIQKGVHYQGYIDYSIQYVDR